MDIRIKPCAVFEARIRDFMREHHVSAPVAVRAMAGDPTAMQRDQGKSQAIDREIEDLISAATPVRLDVWDSSIPSTFGRPGYVSTIVRYMIVALNIGDMILVEEFNGKYGKPVPPATVAVHINKTYKNGTFSILTRGLPDGQYIIRRNR